MQIPHAGSRQTRGQPQTLARDCAEAAHAEAGTGEGLTVDHGVRKAKGLADYADLVLEQKFQRLYELEFQVLRQSADVVVRLYRATFKNIRIDRSLRQELNALLLAGFLLKNTDKFRADNFTLLLRLGNTRQLIKERSTAST